MSLFCDGAEKAIGRIGRDEGLSLKNPVLRADIRPDFPAVKIYKPDDAENSRRVLEIIAAELEKHGETLESVGHITIAYPRKHPELFPGHNNGAMDHAKCFIQAILDVESRIQWKTADGICETKNLDRSQDQTVIHALTQRQEYAFHASSQDGTPPFIRAGENGKKEFFVIVDDAVMQGTTVANLMNFIEYNGGTVLMVSARESDDGQSIVPRPAGSHGVSRMDEMAAVFEISAQKEGLSWSAGECMQKFEQVLKKHGISLGGLTDGECVNILNTIKGVNRRQDTGPSYCFSQILEKLEQAATGSPHTSKLFATTTPNL